jgi:hypothetical protein
MIFSAEFRLVMEFSGTYPHSGPAEGKVVEDVMNRESLDRQDTYFPAKSYLLNQSDRFVWFSPEWNLEFHDAFQDPYEVNDYLGRSFFDLLAGSTIHVIYRSLFHLIRRPESKPLSLTMRCDRVPLKILMSQELSGKEDGTIRVELSYISREPMTENEPVFPFEQDKPLKMCSWCQSIFDHNHAVWMPLEQALGYFPLLHQTELPAITHGCCPGCFQILRGKLYEYSCGR